MTIYSRLKTLSDDRYLKYTAIGSVFAVSLSLLTSALGFVATTLMVLMIAALLIKLLWEITTNVENSTD